MNEERKIIENINIEQQPDTQYVKKSAFVIMPFGAWQDIYYDKIYKSAFEYCGYETHRADDFFQPTEIMSTIWSRIKSATIILADVSGRNPNVFYELGLAHAISKPVILVTSSAEEIPFDLKAIRHIVYNKDDLFWGQNLRNAIIDTLNEPSIEQSIPSIFKPYSDNDLNNDGANVFSLDSLTGVIIDALKRKSKLKTLKIMAHSTNVIYHAFSDYLKTHRVESCELILRKFEVSDTDEKEQMNISRSIDNWRTKDLIEKLKIWAMPHDLSEYQVIIDDDVLISGIYFQDLKQPSKIGYRNVLYVTRAKYAKVIDQYIERFNLQKDVLTEYGK